MQNVYLRNIHKGENNMQKRSKIVDLITFGAPRVFSGAK